MGVVRTMLRTERSKVHFPVRVCLLCVALQIFLFLGGGCSPVHFPPFPFVPFSSSISTPPSGSTFKMGCGVYFYPVEH